MKQDTLGHTGGPWIVEDGRHHRESYGGTVQGDDWRFGLCIRAKDNCHLATVGNVDIRHSGDAKANAQLMAAAPEMLAALVECAKQLRQLDCKGHAAVAEKAIAKAKGGKA